MRSPASSSTLAFVLALALSAAVGRNAVAEEFFVSPSGTSKGDGTTVAPWDLATALSDSGKVKPGDTVSLLAGTYRGGFKCKFSGTEALPITVRGQPRGRVIVDCRPRDASDDGLFSVRGTWTIFRDLEFTCSDPQRQTLERGSWPQDIRRGGIDSRGANIKFVNLLVHDLSNGFGFWGKDATEAGGEIYGCLIFYNGWRGPDRGHGHGIYTQNAVGTKRIVDNIIFDQFGSGTQAYGSEKAALRGYHFEGNVYFSNGSLTGTGQRGTDLLVGGLAPVEAATVLRNYTFGGAGVRFGYVWGVSTETIAVHENLFCGPVSVTYVQRPAFSRNTIIAPGTLAMIDLPAGGLASGDAWRENTYIRTKNEYAAFNIVADKKSRGVNFAQWREELRVDEGSTYQERPASGAQVFVRPNLYEKNRAHIIVYNWDLAPAVEVSLEAALAKGKRYRVVSARDFHGPPIASGVYDGKPIMLSMARIPPVQPVGLEDFTLSDFSPAFQVFVLLPD